MSSCLHVLRMRCPDRPGILARVVPYLANRGCDIRESGVYGDPETGIFFVRMVVASDSAGSAEFRTGLAQIADELDLAWALRNMQYRTRILIAVSKFDHCLLDLLHKWKIGSLPVDVAGIVSNHADAASIAEWYEVPFFHLPMAKNDKQAQERTFLKLVAELNVDLVVLARYMQILSADMVRALSGKCINIHHSFLPSFKGAKPYHQAHRRGVKIIGATAHYVTEDLDEGPIIEQDVRRVTHVATPEELVEIGREVECSVLSRAVKWHAEDRIFLNGEKTVIM